MTTKKILVPTLALALVFLLSVSCQRQAGSEPNPFGPATLHISMELQANPNFLYVTSAGRVTSNIQATVKAAGSPLSGQTVIFTVEAGLGEFPDYSRRIAAVTNAQGTAAVTYVSPSVAEMYDGDSDVLIEAHLQTYSPYEILGSVWLRLLMQRT
ncbi:MAG: Ig-like domain-containing protein [Candidatus Aminicenantes bacterium]|nr:Ig-like domain-containing protein [Candidatus Aminicenantes bacterium]